MVGLLGIHGGCWKEARATLGDCGAAAAVSYILQKGDGIRNAGGYLRRLARKQAAGEMSIDKMVRATLEARRRADAKRPVMATGGLSAAALGLMMKGPRMA